MYKIRYFDTPFWSKVAEAEEGGIELTGTFTSNILYRGKVIERFEEDRIDRNVHVKYTI